ncbi:MAG: hypothetical protein ACJ702_05535 [Nitrososphaeraceae archaeon]
MFPKCPIFFCGINSQLKRITINNPSHFVYGQQLGLEKKQIRSVDINITSALSLLFIER